MKRTPLPVKKLLALRPGDKFVVYWAKDDDPQYVRLNYKTQVVAKIIEGGIRTVDNYDWYHSEIVEPDSNELDTSRGIATFFEVPS